MACLNWHQRKVVLLAVQSKALMQMRFQLSPANFWQYWLQNRSSTILWSDILHLWLRTLVLCDILNYQQVCSWRFSYVESVQQANWMPKTDACSRRHCLPMSEEECGRQDLWCRLIDSGRKFVEQILLASWEDTQNVWSLLGHREQLWDEKQCCWNM